MIEILPLTSRSLDLQHYNTILAQHTQDPATACFSIEQLHWLAYVGNGRPDFTCILKYVRVKLSCYPEAMYVFYTVLLLVASASGSWKLVSYLITSNTPRKQLKALDWSFQLTCGATIDAVGLH